jgi:1,4-dihydroxy-2-naphthoate octaprenyltransferase
MSIYVEAARPRTLVAGIVPVVVGTAASDRFVAWRSFAALAVSVALQVTVNLANDLSDAARGVDAADRRGPRRAVASGLMTPGQAKAAIAMSAAVAVAAGVALASAVGIELLGVGALCLLAALGYSGGPKPYGAAALGEIFVFLFFGLVATVGSAYVQTESVEAVAVAAAAPVGMLASAILLANNLRDIASDRRAGKRTAAVVLGPERTRWLFESLLWGSFVGVAVVALAARSGWPLVALLAAPFARAPVALIRRDDTESLVESLGATARLEAAVGALLALGLWASS